VPIVLLASWCAASAAGAAARVGAWEGSTKAGDYISFDVNEREGGRRIVRAVSFYRCNGRPAYSRWRRVPIVGERFAADGVTAITGRFRSPERVRGRVDPSPGIVGCHGGAKPFGARFKGRRARVAVGEYDGTDSLGNAIAVEVGARGRVIAQFASIGVEFTCGDRRHRNIIRSTAPVRVNGSFNFVSSATPSSRFAVRVAGRFAPDGTVSGSYTVLPAHGCTETSATFAATA
jgi:hypothetical protein